MPVQARGHDGDGVGADPVGEDVLWQEVVFADLMLPRRDLPVRLPQRCQPHLNKAVSVIDGLSYPVTVDTVENLSIIFRKMEINN